MSITDSSHDTAPARPLAFKRHLVPHVVDGEALYLASESGVAVVSGKLVGALAPLLDGTWAEHEICAALEQVASPERVRAAVGRLMAGGWVGYADPSADQSTAAFYESAGLDGDAATAAVRAARVRVETYGDVDAAALTYALGELGITLANQAGDESDLVVALTDDYLQPALADRNARAQAAGTPWLIVRPVGTVIWLGPVFEPGVTGCWECLAQRLAANRQSLSYVQQRLNRDSPVTTAGARMPASLGAGAQLAALEAAKWLAGVRPSTPDVLTFDLVHLRSERHRLIRRPQCACCGDAGLQADQGMRPVTFESRVKGFTADGGHRSCSPEEMLSTYGHQISAITGVATMLVPDEKVSSGLRVYIAGQNLSRRFDDLGSLRNGLRSLSAGKGKTDAQAKASALGEAIERYSGVYRGDEARRQASYRQLGAAAVHPAATMLYSERQYRERARWNSSRNPFSIVPDPFDELQTMDWSPVWSLTREQTRWLPTAALYYGYPRLAGRRTVAADSNGAAAGTSREDAALQGFFELLERDSVALWWYNRLSRPGVDLDAFQDPYIDRMREAYAGMHREVWALDLTADFGIPAMGAFSRRTDKRHEDILIAFGAHFDPHIALTRALTEMNQFVSSAEPLAEGSYPGNYPEHVQWWTTATLENQPYLRPAAGVPFSTPGSWSDLSCADLAEDLAVVRGLVEERGMELLILDQTRPDIGLPVVKVIVPGMRHFWTRFAPGRLYDVPVRLGWLGGPTPEEELNPVAMFI